MIDASVLRELLINHQVIPVKFAGNRLLLDANGVLIWPKYELLIFSDLHLEKGSFLSQFANPLPRFDSKETIKRMGLLLERYQCSQIVCLGDSLHDGNALSRMQSEDLAQLNTLVSSVDSWTWVLGNHDPDIPPAILGQRASQLHIDNLLLVHEPEDLDDTKFTKDVFTKSSRTKSEIYRAPIAQIIGHYHPKSSYKLANRKVTGKSFVCAEKVLLMPAFGKYTGGLDIKDKAFKDIFNLKKSDVYLTYHGKIYLL